ncbi:hypothetical protein C6Y14_04540 [Streptomyces dioscori]|uniref:Uncharacterized protein n=1 Tax=Streptomyces dioscori TaxID=2109333 RepID=A0A2P8QGE1_9ACTN|nr:hypothetical protein [Streptomyces dioscori]PSM45323.1 hypothetical protein C6Y14_04540 [Streptomyces dioscori]
MSEHPAVLVHPPRGDGGRRVTVHGEPVGTAMNLPDIVEFLRRAGLEFDENEVTVSPLIEWRGGGSSYWGPEPGH